MEITAKVLYEEKIASLNEQLRKTEVAIAECVTSLSWASWLESVSPKEKLEIDNAINKLEDVRKNL